MAARDWLRAVRHRIEMLAARSSRAKRRFLHRRAERARAKIRFAPAAPQALEPRSLMTASAPLDNGPSDANQHQHAGAPQLDAVHYVGQAFQPGESATATATARVGWDKLALASAGPPSTTGNAHGSSPHSATESRAHVVSPEHLSHTVQGAGAPHSVSSPAATPTIRTGPLAKALQPAVVARVFSTMYVSGSASGQSTTGGHSSASGFSPFDHFGSQLASGFASGSPPSSRTMAAANAVFAASASASGSSAPSGSGSTASSGRSQTEPAPSSATANSGAASGAGSTSGSGTTMTAASPMFAAGAMDSPPSGPGSGSGGASGGSSSGGDWIPQYLVLYDGFGVAPLAAFIYADGDEDIHRHYTVTQTSSSSDASGTTDAIVTVYDIDLTIDGTVNADGTWTYTEDVISSYTLTVTVAGASSPEGTGSGTFDYDFSASGSATQSQYTYDCHGTDTETGSTTLTSSSTDASGLTTTEAVHEHWTNTDTYSATVTDTTDLTTSAATGTAIENQGATATTSSSGTYSYPIQGGAVNGTTSGSSVQHNKLHASWTISRAADGTVTASGSAHEDTTDNESYRGGGSFTVTASDGYTATDTGTVTESGNSASSAQETVGDAIAADGKTWNQTTGSGSTKDSGAHHYDEAGGGTYSYPIEGGTVSGTTKSSGGEHGSYGYTTKSSFLAGGWSSTGSGSANETSASQNSYSGKGGYVITNSSGDGYTETISGNVSESGSSDDYAHEAVGYTLAKDGSTWLQTSGSGHTHDNSKDDYSYSGKGTYSQPVKGGSVSGTIKESGSNSAGYHEHTKSTWTGAAWSTTGSASDTATSDDQSSYQGGGKYSVNSTGASGYTETINGTITETGASSDSAYDSAGYTLSAAGSWLTTSGGGYTTEKAKDHESSSGAGTYSYQVKGGSVSGTVKESDYDDFSDAYGTISAFDAGKWGTVGGGHETFASGAGSSYTGEGTYSSTNFGSDGYIETLSGTINENGKTSDSFKETDGYTLNASGSWVQSTGSGKSSDTEDNNQSYDGGGGYSYLVAGGTVIGVLSESGYADDAAHYSATSTYEHGGWTTEGSGSSMVHNHDYDSYFGGTTYTRTDTGSGRYTDTVTGTITENGYASDTYYQRKEYEPGSSSGSWVQTSGSGYTSNRSANNDSYVGKGTYNDPAEHTTGTVNENGHNNRTANFSTDSSWSKENWSTTGKGTQTFSSGDNGSYNGSGPITVTFGGSGTASGSGTGMTITGTLTEYGSSGFAVDETDGYTLNKSGTWVRTSGNFNNTRASASGQAVTASDNYKHTVASGTIDGTTHINMGWGVTGTYTVNGNYNDGEWNKTGNGTVINTTFNNASYNGSGSYSTRGAGLSGASDSLSGTLYENGLSDGAFKETDYFKLVIPPPPTGGSDGSGEASGSGATGGGTTSGSGSASSGYWSQSSGTRIYATTIENNASYSGSGKYSNAVPGGKVSGTLQVGGSNSTSASMHRYMKYNGGTWATSSGSATKSTSSGAHWSFDGSGPYTDTADFFPGNVTETVHGTATQSAGSATSTAQTDDFELDVADNTWNNTGGKRTKTIVSHSSVSCSGTGNYSYPVRNGEVSGTVSENALSGSGANFSTHSTTTGSGGVWKTTGTGKVTVKSGQSLSWSGDGTYSYHSGGATVSGTITQDGSSSQSSTVTLGLTAQNSGWTVTSGTGKTSDKFNDDYTLSGGGGYSYHVDGGTVNGTIDENGDDKLGYDYGTTSNYKNGAWSTSGSGTETSSTGHQMTFHGNGSYSYLVPGGTVKGTVTEHGGSNVTSAQKEWFTLNASGSWVQTTGTGGSTDSGSYVRSYQGGGSYTVEDHGVVVKGTVSDRESESSQYDYNTDGHYSSGAWHTTGTGGSSDRGHTMHTYAGAGSASSHTSNGGDTTAYSATVSETGSDHGDWDYKTKAKYAGSGWSESGSGTASALMSATFVYNDKRTSSGTSSSSGPTRSTQSKKTFDESHQIVNFRLSGSTEHYELVDGDWFMSSSDAAGVQSDKRVYGVASSYLYSGVGHSGDFSGGNGTQGADWEGGSNDDNETDKTHRTWSSHTTAVPGGAITTTSTVSGGEQADGTEHSTGYDGAWHETRTSGSGQTETSMSAFSYSSKAHNEYHDSSHWSHTDVTVHSGSGGGGATSGSGVASGGSGSGVAASGSGSGSFAVSGYGTVQGFDSWSDAGSSRAGHWTSSSSYSDSINYWGYSQDANVPAITTSIFFGPGPTTWNDPGKPGELEPGPYEGPLSGTNPEAPATDAAQPETLVALAGFEGALDATVNMAAGQGKTPSATQAPGAMKQCRTRPRQIRRTRLRRGRTFTAETRFPSALARAE